jgi:hypothetical protein
LISLSINLNFQVPCYLNRTPLWQTPNRTLAAYKTLNDYNVISLPAPDGRSETRAKRADQKRKERPQQRMRYRFAYRVCGLLSRRKDIGYPLIGVGLAKPCSCGYQLGQVASVWCRDIPLPQRIRKNASRLTAHRGTIRVRLCTIRTEQAIDEISVGSELLLFSLITRYLRARG